MLTFGGFELMPILTVDTFTEITTVSTPCKALAVSLDAFRSGALATEGDIFSAIGTEVDVLGINGFVLEDHAVLVFLSDFPYEELELS